MDAKDILISANLMIKIHGDEAELECSLKADAFLEDGDVDSQLVWLLILEKVQALRASGGLH